MSSQKRQADPSWEGMPPEMKHHVARNLNLLDRVLLRRVGNTEKNLANAFPYSIETMRILANTTTFNVTIKETDGEEFELPVDSAIRKCALILKVPTLTIQNLKLESEKDAFGPCLGELVRETRGLSNLKVTNFSLSSEIYDKIQLRHTDVAHMPEIREFIEFFDPNHLKSIHIGSKMEPTLLQRISEIQQWRTADSIEITNNEEIEFTVFDSWTGKSLKIFESRHMEPFMMPGVVPPETNPIKTFVAGFRRKAIGASVMIAFLRGVSNLPAQILTKCDSDDSSLYAFFGVGSVRAFVQPNDGTPEGTVQVDEADTRYFDWAKE